jgi:hypothetical protein
MTDVERLLLEYKAAHGDGAGDPRPFLERTSAKDRPLLAALIDAYLEEAPRREFSPPSFRESPAAPVAEAVQRSLAGSAGLWPALLPRLRAQARLKRADVVRELAARLGAESKQDKVAAYYHQMEQGLLPAAGVSDTVLEALGRIVGVAADSLRKAGAMPAPGPPRMDDAAVFARTAHGSTDADDAAPEPSKSEPSSASEWDEVDRLFRGS